MADSGHYAVDQILMVLNSLRLRATYGAVGGAIGVNPRSVSPLLGDRRQAASWVVNKRSRMPTGYLPYQRHPELEEHPTVIESGTQLLRLMREHRSMLGR